MSGLATIKAELEVFSSCMGSGNSNVGEMGCPHLPSMAVTVEWGDYSV